MNKYVPFATLIYVIGLLLTGCNAKLIDMTDLGIPGRAIIFVDSPKIEMVGKPGQSTCALTTDQVAYCWGRNNTGQLGDGTTNDRAKPVAVTGGHSFRMVSSGGAHNCGVTIEGNAYCWGSNIFGALGDETTTTRMNPVAVAGGHKFKMVSAGFDEHTCAVSANGSAYCWGRNFEGQLGDGTAGHRMSPQQVSGSITFTMISSGDRHSCGVSADGNAYCWGWNNKGQVGIGTTSNVELIPVEVSGGHNFIMVSSGGRHSCGVTSNGNAYCWGRNNNGQLGKETNSDHETRPVRVSGQLKFTSISAGVNHTCGTTASGLVYCWGSNLYGGLGNGTTANQPTPVSVSRPNLFSVVSAGLNNSCGVTTHGLAMCWGFNNYGQLGDGVAGNSSYTPVPVVLE